MEAAYCAIEAIVKHLQLQYNAVETILFLYMVDSDHLPVQEGLLWAYKARVLFPIFGILIFLFWAQKARINLLNLLPAKSIGTAVSKELQQSYLNMSCLY